MLDSSAPKLCPVCGDSSRFLFSKYAIGILECRKCKHRFADLDVDSDHIPRVYSNDYFSAGGAGYAEYLADRQLRVNQARAYAKILRSFCVPGYMLDVGAAAGHHLSGFVESGWNGEGVEPNEKMARVASEELGLKVHACALESYVASRHFDLVTLLQVLPHFSDVSGCVKQVSRMIRPGGLCLVESWDRGSFAERLFGSKWHEYSPPSVLHWFDRKGMDALMKTHGLKSVAWGRSMKWISASHSKSLLRHVLPENALGRAAKTVTGLVPDWLRFPYPGDDLIWLLYEKA